MNVKVQVIVPERKIRESETDQLRHSHPAGDCKMQKCPITGSLAALWIRHV